MQLPLRVALRIKSAVESKALSAWLGESTKLALAVMILDVSLSVMFLLTLYPGWENPLLLSVSHTNPTSSPCLPTCFEPQETGLCGPHPCPLATSLTRLLLGHLLHMTLSF